MAGIERLAGESDFEYRMRKICHLHLTRFVRILLDRKDRMSMAVGLEVRVPFCDHRLVEYVYNTPWALKSFDGREKSLLREATAGRAAAVGLRPGEEPYPSTQDPRYVATSSSTPGIPAAEPAHPVFDLVDRTGCAERSRERTADHPGGPEGPGTHARSGAVAGHVQAVAEVEVTPPSRPTTATGCSSTPPGRF